MLNWIYEIVITTYFIWFICAAIFGSLIYLLYLAIKREKTNSHIC